MRRKSQTFTDVELEFMKILWEKGEAAPDEVIEAFANIGRNLTYGTIRNMLVLMIEKGHVARRKQGKVYLYKALVGENEAKKKMVEDILARVFDGSESSMVATLLSGKDVQEDELNEIRRIVDDEKRGDEE